MTNRCSVETQFFRLLNRLVEPYIRAGWAAPRFVPGGLVVLETKGRKTARRSKVPLAAIRIQDRIVVSTFRGDRSQWVKNVAANPEVRYWLRGRAKRATAHVISAAHRTQSQSALPPTLRWLVPTLAPYTYAGWAFAVLSPQGGLRPQPKAESPKSKVQGPKHALSNVEGSKVAGKAPRASRAASR